MLGKYNKITLSAETKENNQVSSTNRNTVIWKLQLGSRMPGAPLVRNCVPSTCVPQSPSFLPRSSPPRCSVSREWKESCALPQEKHHFLGSQLHGPDHKLTPVAVNYQINLAWGRQLDR